MAASNRIKAEMYILFSCNAWHEYSSFERASQTDNTQQQEQKKGAKQAV
ncbi:hypothetical protein [Bacteroides stercoris]|jgi:hypothetical protein|nr:hypothetical protein [Bacteroides stercoris]